MQSVLPLYSFHFLALRMITIINIPIVTIATMLQTRAAMATPGRLEDEGEEDGAEEVCAAGLLEEAGRVADFKISVAIGSVML